ncbi:MAG: hypothetical protein K2W96_00445 [Gemmataceae bacterium]|nr:hypothetical protein [Gemmataceae bacterium]
MDVTSKAGLRCPRCGGAVAVGSNQALAAQFGLIGAIIAQFTTSCHCGACGKIKASEFPPEVRSRLGSGLWVGVVLGLLLLGALVVVLVWLAPR